MPIDFDKAPFLVIWVHARYVRMVEAVDAEPVDVYFARRARSRGTALPVL